jgi:H+/Cl- antiporter ClcA
MKTELIVVGIIAAAAGAFVFYMKSKKNKFHQKYSHKQV